MAASGNTEGPLRVACCRSKPSDPEEGYANCMRQRAAEMEWTPPSLRGCRLWMRGRVPPEPIGISVPEWSFKTST